MTLYLLERQAKRRGNRGCICGGRPQDLPVRERSVFRTCTESLTARDPVSFSSRDIDAAEIPARLTEFPQIRLLIDFILHARKFVLPFSGIAYNAFVKANRLR